MRNLYCRYCNERLMSLQGVLVVASLAKYQNDPFGDKAICSANPDASVHVPR